MPGCSSTDRAGNQAKAEIAIIRVSRTKPVTIQPDPSVTAQARVLQFQVELPGAAVPQPVSLELFSPTRDGRAIQQAEGAAIIAVSGDTQATGLEDGSELHGLKAAATVRFTYDPKQVPDPGALRIYYDPAQQVWVELGGEVDRATNSISVQVEHLTSFAAMAPLIDAPVLERPPAQVRDGALTVTGSYRPGTEVTLVVGGQAQASAVTGRDGRFTLTGRLVPGRNWVYVKGSGTIASQEWSVQYQPRYEDVSGHWAETDINHLADLGIISLYPAPLFQPEERVTRLEFAVMVSWVLNLAPLSDPPPFMDMEAMPDWALPEVSAAVKAGIIRGMPDGSFAPNNLVSRAEMAVMMTRALACAGLDTTPSENRFSDGGQIPAWALEQVLTAARHGLITGYPDGSFQADNSTTRAEAVTMLRRLLNLVSR